MRRRRRATAEARPATSASVWAGLGSIRDPEQRNDPKGARTTAWTALGRSGRVHLTMRAVRQLFTIVVGAALAVILLANADGAQCDQPSSPRERAWTPSEDEL